MWKHKDTETHSRNGSKECKNTQIGGHGVNNEGTVNCRTQKCGDFSTLAMIRSDFRHSVSEPPQTLHTLHIGTETQSPHTEHATADTSTVKTAATTVPSLSPISTRFNTLLGVMTPRTRTLSIARTEKRQRCGQAAEISVWNGRREALRVKRF